MQHQDYSSMSDEELLRFAQQYPSMFQPREKGPTEALCEFLGIDLYRDEGFSPPKLAFLKSLARVFPIEFYQLSKQAQFEMLYRNSNDDMFFNYFSRYWSVSCLFIDKVMGDNHEYRRRIMSTRLGNIYRLNNLRREFIPDDIRHQMTMDQQQHLILNEFYVRQEKQKPPVTMPELKAGVLTQNMEDEFKAGRLDIPSELICQLSGCMFKEPMQVLQAGATFFFEKSFIEEWLKQRQINPFNNQPMMADDLKPAPEKAKEVMDFKAQFKQRLEESAKETSRMIAALKK